MICFHSRGLPKGKGDKKGGYKPDSDAAATNEPRNTGLLSH
jgi:hypothetical protein